MTINPIQIFLIFPRKKELLFNKSIGQFPDPVGKNFAKRKKRTGKKMPKGKKGKG